MRDGFTELEMLIVIIILVILSLVIIGAVSAPELLRRSRDSARFSDIKKADGMLSLLRHDRPDLFFGNASSVYVSVYDPVATSSAGTNCATMGLPALSSGGVYFCAASSTYRKLDVPHILTLTEYHSD